MTKNLLALNLILAASVAVAYPTMGFAQTDRLNLEAKKLVDEGVAFQTRGNLAEAEQKFREALRKYPRADQSDRTAFYLIDVLVRMRRAQDARAEVDNFRRNYPKSPWQDDVDEKIRQLGGLPNPPADFSIWNSPAELRTAQLKADLLYGIHTPTGPADKVYADNFPPNATRNAVILRQIIQLDRNEGISMAKEMLQANPADPAVDANLGTIANSESPQAVPFLLSVWANPAGSPNMRNNAFFWFARMNPDKEEVGKIIIDLLRKRETELVASEALSKMTVADHRAVLEKIVSNPSSDKFALLEKIYSRGSGLLKGDLLMFISKLNDPNATPFILRAAQSDPDPSVRRAAADALSNRKDVDVEVLKNIMRSTPPAPPAPIVRAPQPTRLVPGSGPGSMPISIPALPSN